MRKNNPWVSISDLLSSVVLILLLMFVLAAVLPQYTQEAQRREMMGSFESALQEYIKRGQVQIHVDTGMLEFTSVTFASASAELTPAAADAIKDFSAHLKAYMDENPKMEVLVEGHTAPSPVENVRNKGGYFSNNIQLSNDDTGKPIERTLTTVEFSEIVGSKFFTGEKKRPRKIIPEPAQPTRKSGAWLTV